MTNKLVYLYCLIPTNELQETPFSSTVGIDKLNHTYTIKNEKISGIVSLVNQDDYSQESIDKHLEDMQWIEAKGTLHHNIIAELNKSYTVIPMTLCTIYHDEESLKETIETIYDQILKLFEKLKKKQEWNLKIYYDEEKFAKNVTSNNLNVEKLQEELIQSPKGKQFFLKKKLDKLISEEKEKEIKDISNNINNSFKEIFHEFKINKNWPKQLTKRKEEMLLSSAYLIEEERVSLFFEKINDWKQHFVENELIFETSGPWPPYHFSSITEDENHE